MHESNVTGHFYFLMCKKKKIFFICGIQVYKRAWFHHEQSFMINTGTLLTCGLHQHSLYILSIEMIKSGIQYHLITGALAKAKV